MEELIPLDLPTAHEMWHLTRPRIPARSRLYHLEPIGVGTAYVESLTGYLARLADAHTVHPSALIFEEVLPLLDNPRLLLAGKTRLGSFWFNEVRALNGTATLARDFVAALEALTRRSDLCYLTLLTWAEVLSGRDLLRRTRAWCPTCYEEWRRTGQVIYEPFLWTLDIVTICLRHRRPLQVRCPYQDCQRPSLPLAPRSRPGYCSQCEHWLGFLAKAGVCDEGPEEKELEWQAWVIDVIGDLLAAAPGLTACPRRARVSEALRRYTEQIAKGKVSAMAQAIHVPLAQIWWWYSGKVVPQLESLLRLCAMLGTSPLRFLTEDTMIAAPVRKPSPFIYKSQGKIRTQRRPFDKERVRQALEAVILSNEEPPQAMRQVGRRLGYKASHLYRHFPILCHAIAARRRDYQKTASERHRQELFEDIRIAISTLHRSGLYPTVGRVKGLLTHKGAFWLRDAWTVWRQAVRELNVQRKQQ